MEPGYKFQTFAVQFHCFWALLNFVVVRREIIEVYGSSLDMLNCPLFPEHCAWILGKVIWLSLKVGG